MRRRAGTAGRLRLLGWARVGEPALGDDRTFRKQFPGLIPEGIAGPSLAVPLNAAEGEPAVLILVAGPSRTFEPEHRALADARATVDVLHALLGRLAPWGITHPEDLTTATDPVPPEVRRKKGLAAGLPSGPGVYMFHGPGDEVLYVGTSVNVRKRVQSYFTASEKRRRMTEMLRIAERVSAVP